LFRVVDEATAPPSLALGVLGINGLTAYLGLREVGRPKAGETVLCSTAAGAVGAARRRARGICTPGLFVGSAVGQLAKRAGCRAVGVAGGAAKAALCVDAFAYDACVDYKATDDLGAAVAAECPDGVDVFYDMVGGDQLDAVAPLLNVGARVVVVGTAGTAAWSPPPRGLRLERHLLVKRASMAGFLVFDHAAAFPAALDDLARLVADGSLAHREEVRRGLAAAPRALEDIYRGANAGKLIIAVP